MIGFRGAAVGLVGLVALPPEVGRPDRRPARHTGMKSRAICDLSKEKHTFIILSLVTIKTAETLQNCGLNCEFWRVVYCQKSNKAGARQIKNGSPLRHFLQITRNRPKARLKKRAFVVSGKRFRR